MKFKLLSILVLVTFGILFFTNPGEVAHKEFIKSKLTSIFEQKVDNELSKVGDKNLNLLGKLGKNLLPSLGNELINNLTDTRIKRQNYYLFSTTQVLYKNVWQTIGYGVLNKVYLLPNVEKKLNNLDIREEALKLIK